MRRVNRLFRVGVPAALTAFALASCGPPRSERLAVQVDVCRTDGRLLLSVSSDGNSRIVIANADLSHARLIRESASDAVFSPECDRIAYQEARPADDGCGLSVLRVRGGSSAPLTHERAVCDSEPSFSPDGRSVAFARAARNRPYSMGGYVWDDWDIYLVDVASGRTAQLTNARYHSATRPCFLGSGAVVFGAEVPSGSSLAYGIEKVPADGGAPPKAMVEGSRLSDPAVCWPTGRLAYVSDAASPFNYEIMQAGEGAAPASQVTHLRSYISWPTYSADGRSIYFLSDPKRGSNWELWSVGASGGEARRLCTDEVLRDLAR